jgi:hypothetical protein
MQRCCAHRRQTFSGHPANGPELDRHTHTRTPNLHCTIFVALPTRRHCKYLEYNNSQLTLYLVPAHKSYRCRSSAGLCLFIRTRSRVRPPPGCEPILASRTRITIARNEKHSTAHRGHTTVAATFLSTFLPFSSSCLSSNSRQDE